MSLMTIEEAHEILGEDYRKLSDEEVERIVNDLEIIEIIARMTIRAILKGEMKLQ